MTIYYVLGTMGNGKTLFSSIFAKNYESKYKKIYANYHLNLDNFIYNPFMYIPYNSVSESLIIADDFYALDNAKNLVSVIVNISRKEHVDIILTAQYYTMIPKQIRKVSNYEVRTRYYTPSIICKKECKKLGTDKCNDKCMYYNNYIDTLDIVMIESNGECKEKQVRNAVRKVKKFELYDTNEIVKFATKKNIINEIAKHSNSKEELDINLEICSKSKSEKKEMRKIICEKKGWN